MFFPDTDHNAQEGLEISSDSRSFLDRNAVNAVPVNVTSPVSELGSEDTGTLIQQQRELLALFPEDDPARPEVCIILANMLHSKFKSTNDEQLLHEIINLQRESRALRPVGHPDRGESCNNLAITLNTLYGRTKDKKLLDESITIKREVMALWSHDDTLRVRARLNLSAALFVLHEHHDQRNRLLEAIELQREAVLLSPRGHAYRARACDFLSNSLHLLFQGTGDRALLLEAIDIERELVDLYAKSHPRYIEASKRLSASLLTLHEKTRNRQLLVEAVNLRRELYCLCSSDHPDRRELCRSLSASLSILYEHTSEHNILFEVIGFDRETLASTPSTHEDRAWSCERLADSLQLHHEISGDQQVIMEAIGLRRESLCLFRNDVRERPMSMCRLASTLFAHFNSSGDKSLLNEAYDLEQKAMDLSSRSDPNYVFICSSLAYTTHRMYQTSGDKRSLDKAVELGREALSLCAHDHPERGNICMRLAHSLSTTYHLTSDQCLLWEAIALEREAMVLHPQGHLRHVASSTNLAILLELQFSHTGDEQFLNEAISLKREALSQRPPGHANRAYSCRELAGVLAQYYERTGHKGFLLESIDLGRQALSLCPADHVKRAIFCRSLALTLATYSELTADKNLMTEAINLHREAVALCPPEHPDRGISLRTLSGTLSKLYGINKNHELLDEIVKIHMEGQSVAPPHIIWRHLMGLSWVFSQEHSPQFDVAKSIRYLQQSLMSEFKEIHELINTVLMCLDGLWSLKTSTMPYTEEATAMTAAYHVLSASLPLLVNPVLDLQSQMQTLSICRGVGSDAFVAAALSGKWALGLEIFELTQGLLWSQRLNYRDPQLQDVPEPLANEFQALLDAMKTDRGSYLADSAYLGDALTDRDMRHNTTAHIFALIRKIQLLPGLDRFMLGESFYSLRKVACKHPVVLLISARGYSLALVLVPSSKNDDDSTILSINLDLRQGELEALSFSQHSSRSFRSSGYETSTNGGDRVDLNEGRGMKRKLFLPWNRQMKLVWDKIVKPIFDLLDFKPPQSGHDRPRLYWCPTGSFAQIPLHAAGVYDGPHPAYCHDYVISSYTPSLSSLLRAQKNVVPLHRKHRTLLLVAEKDAHDPSLSAIPLVEDEIDTIATIAESNDIQITQRILGGTKVEAVSSAMEHSNIIHLACHGVQDQYQPTQSGFYLSDGQLTIKRLMGLKMKDPFLAFLSACETATGDNRQPDQAMHMAAAMLFCGFKGVIATMWAISDQDGPLIAKAFYEELLSKDMIDGSSIALALDHAVAEVRHLGVPPQRWASFIHMGA